MVQAKQVFKRYAKERNITINHYHVDNGQFADNGFIKDCQDRGQRLTYCGVNAHFQNGITNRKIRDLQEAMRTSLLNMAHKWPKMITMNLWLYAMCMANEIMISTPTKLKDKSLQELFSRVDVALKIKHFHTFGCPMYVLDNLLQGQHSIPKWNKRARLGIYLGPSPNHSRSAHLILNLRTGHISPQYHVKHGNFFQTVGEKESNFDSPMMDWKHLSCLIKGPTRKG